MQTTAIPAGLMTPGSVAPFGVRSPGANLCHPIWGSGIFGSAGIAVQTIKKFLICSCLLFTSSMWGTPAQGTWFAYMAAKGADNVIPIDLSTNTRGSPISLPAGSAPSGVAITPDRKFAYVTNSGLNTVSVIDIETNTVVASVLVGTTPNTIAITPDGQFAYVTNRDSNDVSVIDTASNTVTVLSIPVGSIPGAIAITPNGQFAYVVNMASSDVSVIDTATNTVTVASIPVEFAPSAIAINPNEQFAYVVNKNSNTISVIDLSTNTVEPSTIAIGSDSSTIAITPNGQFAYVTNSSLNSVNVVDLTTNMMVGAPIPVGWNPQGIAITPDGNLVYVVNQNSSTISVIDTTTNTVVSSALSGLVCVGIAITPDQAPVASFTDTVATAGASSFFNASSSASPVGNIDTYAWDFGDGTTTTTASPTITHTYATSGTFTVTLTVTNSAGTSLAQTFTGQTVSNNGSSLAFISKSITIPVDPPAVSLPPSQFFGKVIEYKRSRGHKRSLKLQTTWLKSASPDVASYLVFANDKLIATIPSNSSALALEIVLKPHNRIKKYGLKKYTKFLHKKYKIRAVSPGGLQSTSVYLQVKRR